MKINTALILCAGYGKRLSPITLKIPKPLIEINEITLLENSINFLEKLDVKNIKINTFYLDEKIRDFILNCLNNFVGILSVYVANSFSSVSLLLMRIVLSIFIVSPIWFGYCIINYIRLNDTINIYFIYSINKFISRQ